MVLSVVNIIDIVMAALITAILPVAIYRKCGLKIGLFYTIITLLYLASVVLEIAYGMVAIKSVMQIVLLSAIIIFAFVYLNDVKTAFFKLSRIGQKFKKEDINASDEELRVAIDEIVKACTNMSKLRTGALIVIAPGNISSHLLETGTELGAMVTSPLLESIFITKGPMHDGAVIVKGNKVLAAGCFLPLSQINSINKNIGTRHRAGIGITEQTDMLCIILSEETGIISVAEKGQLKRYITPERLSDILSELYKISPTARSKKTLK